MWREAADLLLSSMVDSEHVRVVTADLGFGVLDQVSSNNTYMFRVNHTA